MRASGPPTAPSAPPLPFRPFCDSCGSRFEEGQLRPLSKFCSYCGQPLSPWTVRQLALQAATARPPTVPPYRPSLSPTDEEPVRSVGIAGRQHRRQRFLSTSSEDDVDDLPETPIRNNGLRVGRETGRVLSEAPGHAESPSRTKRSREPVNCSIDTYDQKMMRPSVKARSEPTSKRLRTGPAPCSSFARVPTSLPQFGTNL